MTTPAPAGSRREPQLRRGCHSCHATRFNDLKRRLYRISNRLREELVLHEVRVNGAIRHVSGPADVDCARDELVVLCVQRNGETWIESFIEHHLALGAKHIFLLDNDSTDGTVERASRHDGVSVYSTALPFRRHQMGLRRWLTRTFGSNRWSVTCDIDELFDYPFSDRLPVSGLLGYLDTHGYKAMTAHMVDMFSDQPFSRLTSDPEDSLIEKYRYYDLTDVIRTRDIYWIRDQDVPEHIFCTFGGVRERFFGSDCLLQTKHPLVFADDTVGVYTYDGHFMTGAPVADLTGVLLHYKYVASLPELAESRLERGDLFSASRHYAGFKEVLRSDPDFSLRTDTAAELRSVQDLVDAGFITVSPRFREWVELNGRAGA